MKKIINYFKNILVKQKAKYKKLVSNTRWEVRYNNLNKKYQELQEENNQIKEENKMLLKELDTDENLQRIWYLRKYIFKLRKQRDELRSELKDGK